VRRLLKPTRRLLRRVLIVCIVLVAAVNAAAFLLTPLLDRYRDQLAELASARLATPVAIGAMRARWRGFGPELVIEDLRIGEVSDGQGIHLAEAAVDFGIWDMLRYLDLSPLRITLRNLQIHLIREPDGRVQLAGFEGRNIAGEDSDNLPLSGRLRLEDATLLWEDQRLGLPIQRLEHARLRLHLWPDRVSLTASVVLPGDLPGRLRAGAELSLADDDWAGEIYLAGKSPALAGFLAPYLPAPLQLEQGGADVELWSDWQASRMTAAEGRLALSQLRLRRGDDGPLLDLDNLSSEFRYQRDGEDRQLDLTKFRLSRQGRSWPVSDMHLAINLAGPGWPVLQLSADYLRLTDLLALTQPLELPGDLTALRDGLQPDGELFDLRLRLTGGEGPPHWQLSTRFEGLSSQAFEEYPGVTGVAGTAQGDQQQLSLKVSASDSALNWPTLFRNALPVNRLHGELLWQAQADGGHQLSSQALIADTPDIRSVSRLRLDIPADGPIDIDLHSELRDGDGRHTTHYLPTRHMSTQLVDWLDHAISSGRVPQGTLLLRGPLRDFPFDKSHNGRFEVRFEVADLTLNYLSDWPPLQVDDAEVLFHNNALSIQLKHGRLYDSEVSDTAAHIESLDPISPLLINGNISGPLTDPLRLLTESPLKARFGDLVSSIRAKGQSQLKLDMAVVLGKQGKDSLTGSLTLQQAQLALPDWQLQLEQVNGKLDFDLDGVRADKLLAKFQGQPVHIDVAPAGQAHRISAQTRLDTRILRQRLPELPADLISGQAALDIRLDVPNKRGPQQPQLLVLSSDLQGMALQLPAPLGKEAASSRPLSLEIALHDPTSPLRLRYDDLLDALFRPGGDRADIRFGGDAARLPDRPVLRLSGRLPRLDLDPWLALAERQQGKAGALPPLQADLQLDQLKIGRASIDDVHVILEQQPDSWHGSAESSRFAGRFRVPAGKSDAPLQVDLDRLAFTLNDKPGAAQAELPDAGKPDDWPALDLTVASLLINDHDFGRLDLKARHHEGALQIQRLTLAGPLASFDGIAQWRGQGASADSDLVGKLRTPELGKTLAALGYSPQFKDAAAEAELKLGWPGSLSAASLATLRGQIALTIGQGKILELEPGVARAFGLLNFGALQRRLRLDFSDLFGKGMAFDSISGNFRLIDGNAYTSDLAISGPSGDILITGRTGLVDQDLYQEVAVTPRLDATLPVAGALAGGPLAGVAVLLAQTVMKDKVDKFNRIRYSVTGSWDDPKVEQLSGGGGLSRILQPVTDLFGGQTEGDHKDQEEPGQ